jgi:hypothetical protein
MTIRELIERLEDEPEDTKDREIFMNCMDKDGLWELRQTRLITVSRTSPNRRGPVKHLALAPGEIYEEPPCDYSS